ncbi:hypothetical protein AA0119_g2961 [Alternaria tenuissima]|jgi:hypothetical protein|uniref:Uncharacterized protein n=2 Tax=Alternaria alternata complex TaxID=187734 RepID=A0A4Q4NJM9_ALTAL|nr:hypothetical protein AA0115_g3693 [Alternaria tenuissima]RYN78377.1 hypothetical protein AA0117_g4305 [Alternaria alternata]RYO06006.1 hypothetical protein AA0119_g2961 [Alternaria tenuissima]RYO17909.1 hypothetical protein AA0121_g5502 [Alternaria tenuissima]
MKGMMRMRFPALQFPLRMLVDVIGSGEFVFVEHVHPSEDYLYVHSTTSISPK